MVAVRLKANCRIVHCRGCRNCWHTALLMPPVQETSLSQAAQTTYALRHSRLSALPEKQASMSTRLRQGSASVVFRITSLDTSGPLLAVLIHGSLSPALPCEET